MNVIRCALAASLLLLSSVASAALINVAPNGLLTGAQGVQVAGSLYDVSFLDGTCIELFTGCDGAEDFLFNTPLTALQASIALSEQVFLDDALLGAFDSVPGLTNGCGADEFLCNILTPYTVGPSGVVDAQYFANLIDQSSDSLGTAGEMRDSTLAPLPNRADRDVWAVWKTAAPIAVSEPGTLALFAAGLLALWSTRRKSVAAR